MTHDEALSLPKSHHARFLHFYGSSDRSAAVQHERMMFHARRPLCHAVVSGVVGEPPLSVAERERLRFLVRNPFVLDLMACAETNS